MKIQGFTMFVEAENVLPLIMTQDSFHVGKKLRNAFYLLLETCFGELNWHLKIM